MAENPAGWDEATKVIDKAITEANRAVLAGVTGWSLAMQIKEALLQAGQLRTGKELTLAAAIDAHVRENADLHRENVLLRDENSALRGITRVTGEIRLPGEGCR